MPFDSFYSQFDPPEEKPEPNDPAAEWPVPRAAPKRRAAPEPGPALADAAPAWKPPAPVASAYFLPDEPVFRVKRTFQWTRQRVLLAALGVSLAALCVSFLVQPPGESVRGIRRHPERFEGRQIVVRGRVGEVFPMGSSCAYNLHQGWGGRDTIVVFSRVRQPATGQSIAVHGSVSTGYLDGQPRPALFESPS